MEKKYDFVNGEVLLFNKEYKWTSFDLVHKVRNIIKKHLNIKKIKVGHAGTLDPLATGLLIICTGKKTKEINNYLGADKEYIAEITFGGTTPSFDLETEITENLPTDNINENEIIKALKTFEGVQEQLPPIFSAKKINGERAYNKARRGEEVILKPVQITISEIELLKYENKTASVRILCSKGTYIRTFASDLGKKLNSGAYLSGLRRTKIGNFNCLEAITIKEFEIEITDKNN